jgi:hypothetical protein
VYHHPSRFLHDFIAPFKILLQSNYQSKSVEIDDLYYPNQVKIESSTNVLIGKKNLKNLKFELIINNSGIQSISCEGDQLKITALCIEV